MKVLIIGAAGMIGRKLLDLIAADECIFGAPISKLSLVDAVASSPPPSLRSVTAVEAMDFSAHGAAATIIRDRPDLIIYLAAIVSGEAEENFEKGYRVNLHAAQDLFEAIRFEGQREQYRPRVLFASSIAVFGGPFPAEIDDEFLTAPLTSYGTQKAIVELLLSDYSRRGIFEGLGIRLPTICIRPGSPNAAASGFFSSIMREPLSGKEAILPVDDNVRHWFASPRSAARYFAHAATLDLGRVGPRRNLTMPGLSATVADEIEALRRVAGESAVRLIRREPNAFIQRIVSGWAADFDPRRAQELGFIAEKSFDEIVRIYVEDELGGKAI